MAGSRGLGQEVYGRDPDLTPNGRIALVARHTTRIMIASPHNWPIVLGIPVSIQHSFGPIGPQGDKVCAGRLE